MSTEHTDEPNGTDTEHEPEKPRGVLIHVVPEKAAEKGVERFHNIRDAVRSGEVEYDGEGHVRDFVKDSVEWESQILVGGECLGDWLHTHENLKALRINPPE